MKRLLNLPTGTVLVSEEYGIFEIFVDKKYLNFTFGSFDVKNNKVINNFIINIIIKNLDDFDQSRYEVYSVIGDDGYIPYCEDYNEDWFVFFIADENDYCKIQLLSSENLDTGLTI